MKEFIGWSIIALTFLSAMILCFGVLNTIYIVCFFGLIYLGIWLVGS